MPFLTAMFLRHLIPALNGLWNYLWITSSVCLWWRLLPPREPLASFILTIRQYQTDVSIKEEPIYKSQLVCWIIGSLSMEDRRKEHLSQETPILEKTLRATITKELFFPLLVAIQAPEVLYTQIIWLLRVLMSLWAAKEKTSHVLKRRDEETRWEIIFELTRVSCVPPDPCH